MNDVKSYGEGLDGISCDVTACKYNTTDCKCTAGSIKVKNEKASTKGEAYCSTFCQRGCC